MLNMENQRESEGVTPMITAEEKRMKLKMYISILIQNEIRLFYEFISRNIKYCGIVIVDVNDMDRGEHP